MSGKIPTEDVPDHPFLRRNVYWTPWPRLAKLIPNERVRVIGGVLTIMALSGVIFYTELQFRK
jgi:hypothetical protein